MDAAAHFGRGMVALSRDDPAAAVGSLRRALYLKPGLALAAFQLGRAHELLEHPGAARRAYEQALRTAEATDGDLDDVVKGMPADDVAAACRARLAMLIRDAVRAETV